MQLRYDVRRFGYGGDDVVGEVAWMWVGEAHAFEAVDVAACVEQLAERVLVVERMFIGIDVLFE